MDIKAYLEFLPKDHQSSVECGSVGGKYGSITEPITLWICISPEHSKIAVEMQGALEAVADFLSKYGALEEAKGAFDGSSFQEVMLCMCSNRYAWLAGLFGLVHAAFSDLATCQISHHGGAGQDGPPRGGGQSAALAGVARDHEAGAERQQPARQLCLLLRPAHPTRKGCDHLLLLHCFSSNALAIMVQAVTVPDDMCRALFSSPIFLHVRRLLSRGSALGTGA